MSDDACPRTLEVIDPEHDLEATDLPYTLTAWIDELTLEVFDPAHTLEAC